MVERRNHNSSVIGSNPIIIIKLKSKGSIVWFNVPALGAGDRKFKSYSFDLLLNI
jgi:hypothetical protein